MLLEYNAIFEEQVLPSIDDPEVTARRGIDIKTGDYERLGTTR